MTADQSHDAADAYAREFDEAQRRFDEGLKRYPKRPSRLTQFPVQSLTWLALAPTWPTDLAERGFPGRSGILTGIEAMEDLKQISAARLGEFGTADDGSGELFTMTPSQRSAVLDFLQTLPDEEIRSEGVRSYIRRQLTEASKIMREAGESGDVLLTAPLQRWAELAAQAESDEGIGKLLNQHVAEALADAKERGQIVSPEALRWIEAATPFVRWLGTIVEWAVVQACRRIELFYREAYDDRSLKNYFIRSYQEEIFTQLLPEDPAIPSRRLRVDKAPQWALHYVGLGGTGKTMLMRRISAQLADELNLAVARIDFDRLNPDYPARAPGLLLMGFAEELRLHAGDTSADLFERFDKEVEILHQNIKARYDASNPPPLTIDDPNLQIVLRTFIGAIDKLAERKRVVLILDTCEELAKLRSDGSLPNSVRVTFEILELMHERVPGLRVVFAGRRPLASAGHLLPGSNGEKHYNWTCPVSQLPARDYLRLYEIRGFTKEEAENFLEQYTGAQDAKVKRELFSAILRQSCSADKTFDSRFEWHDGRIETDIDPRFNPYDLDMFAEWACADSNIGEAEINAGATQYVKDRIMKRLDHHVKRLLPEVVLLGRFDEQMMRQLIEIKGEHFDTVFSELVSQEWLDVDRNATLSGTVWAIDNIMRKRLYNYYESEEASMFAKAKSFVADFLYNLTLKRDWKELSPAYFDATLRTLGQNKKKLAEWWEQVEERLAHAGQWEWAKELTDQLLGDDGPAWRADPAAGKPLTDECVLRPAVLATQAAAITHLLNLRSDVDGTAILSIWSEVLQKIHRHPDEKAALRLKYRAFAGKVASLRWQPEQCSPATLEIIRYGIEQLPALEVNDDNTAASKIAMLEALIEIGEELALDPGLTRNSTENLARIYQQCYLYLPPWLPDLPADLKVFSITLKGRLEKLCGLHEEAVKTFHQALDELNTLTGIQSLPERVDWHRPEDLAARVKLECARALYPSYSQPEVVLASIKFPESVPESMTTLDADRLASMITQLRAYADSPMLFVRNDDLIKQSIALQTIRPSCNAHRRVPALFSSLLEVDFSRGRISQAIEKGLDISKHAENSKPAALHLQKTADRALLRMAIRTHLRDERTMVIGESLAKAKFESLDDINLRFYAYALDGSRSTATLKPYFESRMDEQRRARLTHIAWRSGREGGSSQSIFELGRSDVNATFVQFSLALDAVEAIYLLHLASRRSGAEPETHSLVNSSRQWAIAHPDQPVEALTLQLRALALDSQPITLENTLRSPVNKIGSLRAAEIALEEGTLLALRMPARAFSLLSLAHSRYQQCNDTFGQFLTTLRMAMLYAATQKKDQFQDSLLTMKREYHDCSVAADVGLPSWEQLEDLIGESNKATIKDNVAQFLMRLESSLCWRPLMVRVLGCLIRGREFSSAQDATEALLTWVRSNYSTAVSEQQYIPPDISYLFTYKEAAVIPKDERSWLSRIKESGFFKIASNIVTVAVSISLGIAGIAVLAKIVKVIVSFVMPISSGVSIFLTIALLVVLSKILPIWHWVSSVMATLWTRRIFIRNLEPVKDPNRPLLSRLGMDVRTAMVAYDVPLKPIESKSDDSYRELAQAVPQKNRKAWERINRWAGNGNRYVRTKIVVDEDNCAAPWEAIRGLPSEDIWSFEKSRLITRRNLKARDVTQLGRVFLPVEIVTLASSVSQTELGQRSWKVDQKGPAVERLLPQGRGDRVHNLIQIRHEIDKPAAYMRGVFRNFDVVHIIGTPTQTSSGVRLEIQGAEAAFDNIYENQESQTLSPNRAESRSQGYLLSGEELARSFPRLRICVVQGDTVIDDSRNATSRYEAALLRRFGTELFRCGIPAVVLLPPLPEKIAIAAIRQLNDLILREVQRGPRKWWQRRTPLAQAVRAMQDSIVKAYTDNEKAIEIAFDLCLYMEDGFDFDVAALPF